MSAAWPFGRCDFPPASFPQPPRTQASGDNEAESGQQSPSTQRLQNPSQPPPLWRTFGRLPCPANLFGQSPPVWRMTRVNGCSLPECAIQEPAARNPRTLVGGCMMNTTANDETERNNQRRTDTASRDLRRARSPVAVALGRGRSGTEAGAELI